MNSKVCLAAAVFFLFSITIGYSHTARADDACAIIQNDDSATSGTDGSSTGTMVNAMADDGTMSLIGDPQGAISSNSSNSSNGSGGYGGNHQTGEANTKLANSLSAIATLQANAKHQMVQNSMSISANIHYCFSQIQNIYHIISTSSLNISVIAISLIVDQAVDGLIKALCQLVLTTINSAVQQVLGIINNLLCVPMPKLQLPGIHIPGLPSTSCHGTSLAKVSLQPTGTNSSGSPNNVSSNNLLWTMWGNKLNLKVQQ